MRLPEGDFTECVGYPDDDDDLPLPEGRHQEKITLREPWVVCLPTSTTTLWWSYGDSPFIRPRSYQMILP
ncbi:MAG: hypothetical protein AAGI88_25970, partial [Pseudomonadota bacterium]